MTCYGVVITIYQPFRCTSENVPVADAFSTEARRASTSAALAIAKKMSEIHAIWGTEYTPLCMLQWCTLATLTLIDDLQTEPHREAFDELCISLRSFARRWLLAKAILRTVQLTARKTKVALPETSRKLFETFEQESWTEENQQQLRSLYPNISASAAKDGGPIEMDQFIRKWEAMDVSD
jgi:hypothetical protein